MSARPSRPLRDEEKSLIVKLLDRVPERARLIGQLDGAGVEEMHDGGMGSVLFQGPNEFKRRLANEVASGRFKDTDGTAVVVSVNIDQFGDLFELDLWKVDFSALIRFPRADEVELEERRSG